MQRHFAKKAKNYIFRAFKFKINSICNIWRRALGCCDCYYVL